eukprot:COSAG04_NODE_6301_length_1362_cov_1.335709_1_plen_185_part_00
MDSGLTPRELAPWLAASLVPAHDTSASWTGQGPDALKIGEVVPQLVGPLRGEGKNPLGTEFSTGSRQRSRHPSAKEVQALSRDMGIALIYDKSCRLDSDDDGYRGGHFRVRDNSDPNQNVDQKHSWGGLSIGAIVNDSLASAAFSDTEEDDVPTSDGTGDGQAAASTGNYYQVLDDLDEDGHLN